MTDLSSHDHRDFSVQPPSGNRPVTAVLEVKGLHWASERAFIEASLGRLEGVRSVEDEPGGADGHGVLRPGGHQRR